MRKEKKYVTGWDQVSLKKYQMMLAVDPESEDAGLERMAIANDMTLDELMNAPLTEANDMAEAMQFMQKPPKPRHTKKVYVINGREYTLKADPRSITTAQYIDYDQLQNKADLLEVLAIVMVPPGHLYNDGYDFEQAKSDMGDLTVEDAVSISDFFTRALSLYTLVAIRQAMKALKQAKKDGMDVTEQMRLLKETRKQYGRRFFFGLDA